MLADLGNVELHPQVVAHLALVENHIRHEQGRAGGDNDVQSGLPIVRQLEEIRGLEGEQGVFGVGVEGVAQVVTLRFAI